MNNEETIIMQPQSNNKAQQTSNAESTKKVKPSGNGKNVTAMTGAAVFGGAAGGAGTAAAANILFEEHVNEDDQMMNQDVAATEKEESAVSTTKPETKLEPKAEEIEVTMDVNSELDYTGNAGADPVVEDSVSEVEVQPTGYESDDVPEVQVLGVYQDEEGMEAAILTNGEEIAAVVDVDGDGYADTLLVDENHNEQIDEDEIYDVSDGNIEMSQFEEAYLAQQQEQVLQENETFAYNADDQQDYNNDAPDLSFA